MAGKLHSQSAMEYLMTYGWAILIIAVVLGAIYSLGLFNGATLAPRAQPGSCEVLRPNGALTLQYVSLAGACTNELPQYVAQFGGVSSYIQVPAMQGISGATGGTISGWFYLSNLNNNQVLLSDDWGSPQVLQLYIHPIGSQTGEVEADFGSGGGWIQTDTTPTNTVVPSTWYHLVATWQSGVGISIYVNGALKGSNGAATGALGAPSTGNIGYNLQGSGGYASGLIANLQIYNATLDANSVKALYQEGIGGAPINLQSLVAWWPLNGNANDYSGNVNNGVPTNVVYTNQWLSGYTVP